MKFIELIEDLETKCEDLKDIDSEQKPGARKDIKKCLEILDKWG